MGAIDIHAHAFPDKLARRAVPALAEQANFKAVLDGRVKSLLKSMDAADIDISVVCSIATKPDQVEDIFQWSRKIRSDRIDPFPSIHPDTPDPTHWTARFAEAGLTGIKLHPMYQDCAADDPRVLAICRAAAEADLIVMIHCGRDFAFGPDDDRAAPSRIRRVLEAVPGLKLLATHMGGWRMWDEAEQHLIGTDCYMETSFTSELPAERLVALMRKHGTDRVIFGSDSPWTCQAEELRHIRCLGLTRAELDKTLFANAARLLRV